MSHGAGLRIDLRAVRVEFGVTQAEFADLLGVSLRTVQACEQGWRNPSPALEKATLLLLLGKRRGDGTSAPPCWEVMDCPPEERSTCLALRIRQGHLCWLLTGNFCSGMQLRSWAEKKAICLRCRFFLGLFSEGVPTLPWDTSERRAGGGQLPSGRGGSGLGGA